MMSIISQSINSYLNVFLCYSYDEQVTKLITKLKIASIMITLFVFFKVSRKYEKNLLELPFYGRILPEHL